MQAIVVWNGSANSSLLADVPMMKYCLSGWSVIKTVWPPVLLRPAHFDKCRRDG